MVRRRAAEPATGVSDEPLLKGMPFRLADNPIYLMTRAIDRVARNVDAALGAHRFSQTQWRILVALSEQEPLSIGELSEITFVEGSALGRAVAKMEQAGLVRRQPDAADRRVVRVRMTARGRARLAQLKPVVIGETNSALAGLSKRDVQRLNRHLHSIAAGAERSGRKAGAPRIVMLGDGKKRAGRASAGTKARTRRR
ncbi:MAG TPA: MarR family transcriptional regulator [Alphaproteobacteria bacterium]